MCRMHTLWSNLYNISLSHSLAAFTRWNSVHFFRYNFHHVELFFYFHLVVVICEWNILMKNILKEKTRHFFCMIPRCRCAIQFISLSLSLASFSIDVCDFIISGSKNIWIVRMATTERTGLIDSHSIVIWCVFLSFIASSQLCIETWRLSFGTTKKKKKIQLNVIDSN